MKILLVSRDWPSKSRSGVSLAAKIHSEIIIELGHDLFIVGSNIERKKETFLSCENIIEINSRGNGSIYSPSIIDKQEVKKSITDINPDIILVEGWQTAITDTFIKEGKSSNVPVIMISHGISIHPFDNSFLSVIRSIGWIKYRYIDFHYLIKNISLLATLDNTSQSKRFYDRALAIKNNIPIEKIINIPINVTSHYISIKNRKKTVLVIGYYSYIKNQLKAIEIAHSLIIQDKHEFKFKFIGKRQGRYYQKCRSLSKELALTHHIEFLEDHECNIGEEIAKSYIVLSTSITEAFPITLLEAIASGTPFIATNVGANYTLKGGLISSDIAEIKTNFDKLLSDENLWKKLSTDGRNYFLKNHTKEHLKKSMSQILNRFCEK